MLAQKKDGNQLTFNSTFEEQLDKKHPLYVLSKIIDWEKFEKQFEKLYNKEMGAPAKPIRLMVGLLIIKHLRNISDETVVEQWSENLYYQNFCGERYFVTHPPCEASELVHFRKRIGETGIEMILQESIRIQATKDDKDTKSDKSKSEKRQKREEEVVIDTTVQEKNITFPTDDKLYKKVISKCIKIAFNESIELRQSYKRTVKNLTYKQRFRNSKKNSSIARAADRKIKTIAGRLVREIERKLSPTQMSKYYTEIELFKRVMSQKREDKNKVYSLHEPQSECISKGKAHKKYEFGSKASIIIGKTSGIIYGALNIEKNDYDGHTLPKVLEQFKRINGYEPKRAIVDLGYRGTKKVGETEIILPQSGMNKSQYEKQKQRKDHRRRSSIEGKISHVKHDYRMERNYYKGTFGDNINVILAASASNFKSWMNNYKRRIKNILFFIISIIELFLTIIFCEKVFLKPKATF